MAQGYCTVDDVRRALREAGLPGDAEQDRGIVLDAITARTEPLEKRLDRHWYEPTGVDEDTDGLIPTAPKSRDDEESIPTGGAHVVGEPVTPKTWQGSYTRIQLHRRDVQSIDELLVRTEDGAYVDWVAGSDFTGGTWPDAAGEDYYLRINNGGVSDLYLDSTHFLDADDEPVLESFANAVYVTYTYGQDGLPQAIRRAVAFQAGADLVEDAVIEIPTNTTIYNVETKAEEMREQAEDLLEVYL